MRIVITGSYPSKYTGISWAKEDKCLIIYLWGWKVIYIKMW